MKNGLLTLILAIGVLASATAQDDRAAGMLPEFLRPEASDFWLRGRFFDLQNGYDVPLWRISERGMPMRWIPSPWAVEPWRPGGRSIGEFLPVNRLGVQGTMDWIRRQQQRSVIVQPTVNGERRVDFRTNGRQGSSFSISIRSY